MCKFVTALALAALAATVAGIPETAEASPLKPVHLTKAGHVTAPHKVVVIKPYVFKHYGAYNFSTVGYVAPTYYGSGCGYFLHKWQATGAWYWKHKYFVCKGW